MIAASEIDSDCLPCGIVKLDKNRKVVLSNRYALDLMSCKSLDVIADRSINELLSVASRIFLDSYVYPMLLEEGEAYEIQLTVKSLTGEKKPIVANISINPDKTTCWTFMGCVNRDSLYNEMLSARDTLQSQALNLTQLNSQLMERKSELQTFCHSLSHDFNGPLLKIKQIIRIVIEELMDNHVEAPEEFALLSSAGENAANLMELINGLVEYLVSDVPVSRNELVDLTEIFRRIMSMREQNEDTSPKVHWTSLPTVFGNKVQMQVLFKNLIENAIKYNQNIPDIVISHTEDLANNRCIIAIQDNGIGMSDTDTIFTPFKRLNSADDYKGSGLGLSIVKKLVTLHNGDIRVESKPGKGSIFYVSLPLNRSEDTLGVCQI